jgi:phospholipase/carboxylesterase
MDETELADLMALLPALLGALEVLGFVARHFNPPDFAQMLAAIGEPDAALRAARPRLAAWPERLGDVRAALETASDHTLAGFDGLREAGGEIRPVFRALGHLPRAQEALYPLAGALPPVSRFFLEPGMRGDGDLQARLAQAPPREDVGVMHLDNDPGSRGGFSAYVPEDYSPDRAWPLVMALHGGAGNGRSFLWSWLRDARSHGAILIAPRAVGDTWALTGPDRDTPNLMRMVDWARGRWNIDPGRILLTGMSDGGTFSYVSGLEPGSPFTHLAPAAAAFHPMLAQMADPARIGGLPIHVSHGVLDWMFPVDMAREAARVLTAAGAHVTYRELDDLSHTYPRELNPQILRWMSETAAGGQGRGFPHCPGTPNRA